MRSLQQSGGKVSYTDVILGASSFSELILRMGTIKTIMKADADIIEEQKYCFNYSQKEKR